MAKKNRDAGKGDALSRGSSASIEKAVPIKALRKRKGGLSALAAAIGGHRLKGPVKEKSKGQPSRAEAPLVAADKSNGAAPPLLAAGRKRLKPKTVIRATRLGQLERLEYAIEEVRLGGRASPRTRKLQQAGIPKMAQKFSEEAAELTIEAVQGNQAGIVNEAVDVFYNMIVLLSASGVSLETLWVEMDRREAMLGMAEKLPKVAETDF